MSSARRVDPLFDVAKGLQRQLSQRQLSKPVTPPRSVRRKYGQVLGLVANKARKSEVQAAPPACETSARNSNTPHSSGATDSSSSSSGSTDGDSSSTFSTDGGVGAAANGGAGVPPLDWQELAAELTATLSTQGPRNICLALDALAKKWENENASWRGVFDEVARALTEKRTWLQCFNGQDLAMLLTAYGRVVALAERGPERRRSEERKGSHVGGETSSESGCGEGADSSTELYATLIQACCEELLWKLSDVDVGGLATICGGLSKCGFGERRVLWHVGKHISLRELQGPVNNSERSSCSSPASMSFPQDVEAGEEREAAEGRLESRTCWTVRQIANVLHSFAKLDEISLLAQSGALLVLLRRANKIVAAPPPEGSREERARDGSMRIVSGARSQQHGAFTVADVAQLCYALGRYPAVKTKTEFLSDLSTEDAEAVAEARALLSSLAGAVETKRVSVEEPQHILMIGKTVLETRTPFSPAFARVLAADLVRFLMGSAGYAAKVLRGDSEFLVAEFPDEFQAVAGAQLRGGRRKLLRENSRTSDLLMRCARVTTALLRRGGAEERIVGEMDRVYRRLQELGRGRSGD